MKISLNEIKKLVPAASKIEPGELVKLIGSRLVEVEGSIDLAKKYKGAYIVKVVECEPIPDTHLHLCRIDAGNISQNTSKEGVQVVCGAPNVRKGMLAVWLTPGSIVPQTFGEENFKLGVRKLRGYESNGMLAGLDEIDLGDDHSGIVEIDSHQKYIAADGTTREVTPGDTFAEVFDLNDIILDIENKSLTHRPDTFGLIGFAREVAGILGEKFEYTADAGKGTLSSLHNGSSAIKINITDPALCSRYSCAVIEMSDALSDDKYLTPMDVFLAKAGMRGISKIVDVTNYLMLMTGQPLHAFDYDKFLAVGGAKSPEIIIRAAQDGEELQLLDGKTIKCNPNDILVTSNGVPVALAGAMGGASTEIDASTKRIILESATFSLYNLRKTQMAHGIFSEAITRFTKGQPASQTMPVLQTAIDMLGGTATEIADSYPTPAQPDVVKITTSNINNLLGTDYSAQLIQQTLENVGFKVVASKSTKQSASQLVNQSANQLTGQSPSQSALIITAPAWRTDIHIKEDIIEEVGRLLGYDNIPLGFPTRPFIGAAENPMLSLKTNLRDILSGRLAAHELLTYSFVSKKLQQDAGENPADSYEIINSISPELQCFRQTLIPSLLEKTRDNLKSGYQDFSLYEINQVTKKSYGLDQDQVPVLYTHLAMVTTGDFYVIKSKLTALLESLGFKDLSFHAYDGHFPYFEPLHSATVQTPHVCLGEIKQQVLKRFKINQPVSAFEIDLSALLNDLPNSAAQMPALSKYPSVERDITLKVSSTQPFAAARDAILGALDQFASQASLDLIFSVTPVSIYQQADGDKANSSTAPDSTSHSGSPDTISPDIDSHNATPARPAGSPGATKNLSFHLNFASRKKTLGDTEISAIIDTVTKSVKEAVGAEIV